MYHLRILAGFYYLNINSVKETFCFLTTSEQINSTPFYFLNSALLILQHGVFNFPGNKRNFCTLKFVSGNKRPRAIMLNNTSETEFQD